MYTTDEILILAQTWADAHGYSLFTASRRALGKTNAAMFMTLAGGGDCRAKTLVKASKWFNENWPNDVPWPLKHKKEVT